ncbi:MAG: cytidylate kinase [Candidatus Hydrogenedentota bacterium]
MQNATDIIAIDGPAGAGKSTIAREVARALGYAYLDTGAMYRGATWWAIAQNVDLDDADALARAARAMRLELRDSPHGTQVFVGGQDITAAIRTPEITRCIAKLDHNPEVRAHLVELQRQIGAKRPTVCEGRDIGTVVFPKAKCKIYLNASLEERTRRRAREFDQKGIAYDPEALREEIRIRDEKDATRNVAPLRKADDAVEVDTTGMTPREVVETIVRIAKEKW